MDFGFCGVVDIVLVVFAIIMAVLGFKKGFMKKILSHIGILVIFVFSFFYAAQFAQMLISQNVIYPSIYDSIYGNINQFIVDGNYAADATVNVVLSDALGIPEFLANLIINGIGMQDLTVAMLAAQAAKYIAETAMNGISFLILVVGLFIILGLLKLIVNLLRESSLLRFIDGVLGIVYYIAVGFIFVTVLFYFVSLAMDAEWFAPVKDFLVIDMQLATDEFRLSKVIYDGNILVRILGIFGL